MGLSTLLALVYYLYRLGLVRGLYLFKSEQTGVSSGSSIIIEDEKGNTRGSKTDGFADLGMLEGLSTSSIENEIGLLSSRRLMTNAVKALGLNVVYYQTGSVLGIKSKKFPIRNCTSKPLTNCAWFVWMRNV